jgi:hypothetical protein
MPRYTTRFRTETMKNKTLDSTNTVTAAKVNSLADSAGVVRLLPNATAKTIADAGTDLFEVAVAAGASCSGVVHYSIFASNGTDHQSLTGNVTYAAVN